jgi:ATP-dependent helicase/nuclease subunit A
MRGTVFHAWFQTIRWIDEGVADDAKLLDVAAESLRASGSMGDPKNWLSEFREMLSRPEIRKLLTRTTYPKTAGTEVSVQNERPFAVRDEQGLLTGNIDRLVLATRKAAYFSGEIIDFKTDQLPSNSPAAWQSRIEHYRPQIDAYRRAVRVLTGLPLDKISAKLVFVATGRVVDL